MANLRANKIYGTSGPDANGSALFNGTDYLTAANAAAFRLNQGSGADFTIEAWIYAKSVGTQFHIAGLYVTSGNKRSYLLYVSSDGELKINYSASGTAGSTSALNAGVIPTNEWIHVAVTHDTSATTLRLFKNGLMKTSDTSAHATWYANTDGDFEVGTNLDGFISNLHINKGTCKYTASFDPYKQPIEVETNTSVLCCNSSTDALNDDKSNTFVQTASEGVKPTSDMPFSRSDAGTVLEGDITFDSLNYMTLPKGTTAQSNRGRGMFIAAEASDWSNVIQYIQIQTLGTALDFGDLIYPRRHLAGTSSATRGVCGGGVGPSWPSNKTTEYSTLATTGNALSFGELLAVKYGMGCMASSTRGIFSGGYTPSPVSGNVNIMEYITFATTGNALDFGDQTDGSSFLVRYTSSGISNGTRGTIAGGYTGGGYVDTIVYVPNIASLSNTSDFGNLSGQRGNISGCSDKTRGVFMGGYLNPASLNIIEYITLASTGSATDFGDLTNSGSNGSALSNSIRGVTQIGNGNIINYVNIQTTGNATHFGDLNTVGGSLGHNASYSDSHGGLSQ